MDDLVTLLHEDAALRMPSQPSIVGAQAIAELFDHRPCGGVPRDTAAAPAWANGRPAVAVVMRHEPPDGTSSLMG